MCDAVSATAPCVRHVVDGRVTSGNGLVVVLPPQHPFGDFGFCRYVWTSAEQETFWESGRPPRTIDRLPAETPIVPIQMIIRQRDTGDRGPRPTPAQFRRLDYTSAPRLIIIHFGSDSVTDYSLPVAVVPSPDFGPTADQRTLFQSNVGKKKTAKYFDNLPRCSGMLNRNLLLTDYVVGATGALVYGTSVLGDVWELLTKFNALQPVAFPKTLLRNPRDFQHSLCTIHQAQLQYYADSQAVDDDSV